MSYVSHRLCGEAPFYYISRRSLYKNVMKQEVQFKQPAWLQVSDAGDTLSPFSFLTKHKCFIHEVLIGEVRLLLTH